jgi:hypothetical protein
VIQPDTPASTLPSSSTSLALEESLQRRKEKYKKLSKEKRKLQRQLKEMESERDSTIQREVGRQVDHHNATIQCHLDTIRERTIQEKQQFQIQYATLNDKLLETLQEQVTTRTMYDDLKRELTKVKGRNALLERKYRQVLLLLGQHNRNHLIDTTQLWNLNFQVEECIMSNDGNGNKYGEETTTTILFLLLQDLTSKISVLNDDNCEMKNRYALLPNSLQLWKGEKRPREVESPNKGLNIDHTSHDDQVVVRMIQEEEEEEEETTRLTLDVRNTTLERSELQLQSNGRNDSDTRQRRTTGRKRGSSSSSSSSVSATGFFFHRPSSTLFSR